jgi:transposase
LPPELSDDALEARLYPEPAGGEAPTTGRPLPDFAQLHEDLRKHKHTTLHLLWSEYRAAQPDGYSYSRFCFIYEQWKSRQSPVMRQVHKAGEKLFVDWAGMKIPLYDRHSGEVREASLFVAVLGASLYTYAEATLTERLPDWCVFRAKPITIPG